MHFLFTTWGMHGYCESWEMKQEDTLTAFLHPHTSFRKYYIYRYKLKIQKLVALKWSKCALPLQNPLGDAHLSLKTTDVHFYIILLNIRETGQIRLGLRWDTVHWCLYLQSTGRTVTCTLRSFDFYRSLLSSFIFYIFFINGNNL